jgi:hypothetical protein
VLSKLWVNWIQRVQPHLGAHRRERVPCHDLQRVAYERRPQQAVRVRARGVAAGQPAAVRTATATAGRTVVERTLVAAAAAAVNRRRRRPPAAAVAAAAEVGGGSEGEAGGGGGDGGGGDGADVAEEVGTTVGFVGTAKSRRRRRRLMPPRSPPARPSRAATSGSCAPRQLDGHAVAPAPPARAPPRRARTRRRRPGGPVAGPSSSSVYPALATALIMMTATAAPSV